MTRLTTAMRGGAAALALAAAAPATAEIDEIRWAVPISFASTLTALGDTLPWVAERLEAVSDGRIMIEVVEPGAMIPALAVFESAATGQIEAGYSWMGYERGSVPASALFGATPFGLEPAEFVAWMYEAGGDALLKETFEPFGVYPILCGTIPPEAAGWFTFPLESVDQLQGLNIRAAGLGGEILAEVGASVTVLPGGELYQALETGVIDATEFSLPTVDKQLGFDQVAKFYHLPGWHQPSTSQYLYVNMGVWEGLSDQTKAVIETTCMAGTVYAMARGEALQGPVLTEFEESGVTAVQVPDDVLQRLREATDVVMERESAADPQFAKVYEAMMAFQADLQPWRELGYLPRDFGSDEGPAQ